MPEKKTFDQLLAEKIEAHHFTRTICEIEDPVKRNAKMATKRWKSMHPDRVKAANRKWAEAHPEKVREARERQKPNIKRWAKEHPERRRELNRKHDRKRAKDPKRIAWTKEYLSREDVKERRREADRKRNRTPERKAYERERGRRRRAAAKLAKEQNAAA